MRNLRFLLFPLLLCLSEGSKPESESCTKLKQTLGLGSKSNPPENIRECRAEQGGEEGGRKEGIGSKCSCEAGFKKCGLSLMPESSLEGPRNETKNVPQAGADHGWEEVLKVAGVRFSRRYEDESSSDLRLEGGNHCNFCCHEPSKEKKLGTALAAGVMLGMIVVVVLISIAASKLRKCSAKANSEEMQEPETKKLTNTV